MNVQVNLVCFACSEENKHSKHTQVGQRMMGKQFFNIGNKMGKVEFILHNNPLCNNSRNNSM